MNFETPTTELEVMNVLLESIGEMPVNSIETSGVGGSSMALNMVRRISRQTQAKGLWCNTERDYPLTPNADNEIVLPSNVLDIKVTGIDAVYTMRGNKLYNITDHTYVFEDAIEADELVLLLDFTDLPEYVRDYVTIKAAREFQANRLGDTTLYEFTKEDEYSALRYLKTREDEHYDYNIFNNASLINLKGGMYRRP